ncbi:hypothetical protein FQR65_LT18804 [Abscondita terminalis]|nr:hypothetical protein FQR65_LT18804 [Abscondita terminalis]
MRYALRRRRIHEDSAATMHQCWQSATAASKSATSLEPAHGKAASAKTAAEHRRRKLSHRRSAAASESECIRTATSAIIETLRSPARQCDEAAAQLSASRMLPASVKTNHQSTQHRWASANVALNAKTCCRSKPAAIRSFAKAAAGVMKPPSCRALTSTGGTKTWRISPHRSSCNSVLSPSQVQRQISDAVPIVIKCKVAGKVCQTNDYTTAEQTKTSGIANNATTTRTRRWTIACDGHGTATMRVLKAGATAGSAAWHLWLSSVFTSLQASLDAKANLHAYR